MNRRPGAARSRPIESLEPRTLLSTVFVNSTSDTATGPNIVTLRDAIAIADAATTATTITFDPTVFATAQTITLDGSTLELTNTTEPTTITGPAAGLTISGNNLSTGFTIDTAVAATLSNLTIVDCNAGVGAAISNSGALTLTGCTLADNDANTNDDGAGIADTGTETLINDTIANNTGDGLDERGGSSTIINCTFSGNYSYSPFPGGGIYIQNGGTVTIGNSIVAGNTADTGGPDVYGPFTSLGNNLIGTTDGSTGWISSDRTGTMAAPLNADLGTLADNGGPTATMMPAPASPAINAGSVALIPPGTVTDQRGLARVVDGKVDIGSVESAATAAPSSPSGTVKTIGGLDPSFGIGGLAAHDVGFSATDGVAADGTQSVLIGPIGTAPNRSFGITRYNSDGSLDTTFATAGVASTAFGSTDAVPTALAVLPNGDILVAGTATTYTSGLATGSEFAVAEYTPTGSLDPAFGAAGQTLISFSPTAALSNDLLNALAVGPAGTIYLAGSSDAAGKGNTDLAIAALSPTGQLDTAFGTGGKAIIDVAGGDDAINSLAIQRNGEIVAAGAATVGGGVEVVLARFLAAGTLDPHFGAKGLVTDKIGTEYDSASSVVIQTNGAIVVGGLTASGSGASLYSDFFVQRYTTAGRLDRTFGGGTVVTDFGQPSAVTQLLLESNGDIVASGKTTASLANVTPDTLDVAIARYTTRGTLDTSFNATGKAIVDLSAGEIPTPTLLHPDASALGAEFDAFTSSLQGVVASTTGGEILSAGNSGANTVEAELIAAGIDLLTKLLSSVPAAVLAGSRATAAISITENGTQATSGVVTVTLELATDAAGDGAVTIGTASERISLKQAQARSYRLPYTYPDTLAGSYYLLATVTDPAGATELNPANNTAASATAIAVASPFIALDGSGLTTSSALAGGKIATFSITVTNNGNVLAAGHTTLQLLLSPDETPADGTPIATQPLVVSLAAGRSRTYRFSTKFPATAPIGTFNLLALLDPTNTLGTTDRSDTLVIDPTEVSVSA